MVKQSQGVKIHLGISIIPSLARIDMHYFCSLISFSILFRNTVFLVSISEMRHYKLSMNSLYVTFSVSVIPFNQYLPAK